MMRVCEVVCENCVIKNLCPRVTLISKVCWMPNKEMREDLAKDYNKAVELLNFPHKI